MDKKWHLVTLLVKNIICFPINACLSYGNGNSQAATQYNLGQVRRPAQRTETRATGPVNTAPDRGSVLGVNRAIKSISN